MKILKKMLEMLTCQRKKRQRAISMGASHTALKYTTKSMSFWVSAETRFTISPTVHVLRAALFITRDYREAEKCSFRKPFHSSLLFISVSKLKSSTTIADALCIWGCGVVA